MRENPKESIRKFLELIIEFSKVAGCKINTQKSLAFLYTNNEKSEREIKESIPFTIAAKQINHLGIKRLPAMQEIRVWSLGQEDPLEKEMETHSSTLAWKIPWMEKPDGLQSMVSQRVGHDWATSLKLHFLTKETKELYTENYKTLIKEIKDDMNRKQMEIYSG